MDSQLNDNEEYSAKVNNNVVVVYQEATSITTSLQSSEERCIPGELLEVWCQHSSIRHEFHNGTCRIWWLSIRTCITCQKVANIFIGFPFSHAIIDFMLTFVQIQKILLSCFSLISSPYAKNKMSRTPVLVKKRGTSCLDVDVLIL